jgi:hypothetical protein
LQPPLIYVLNNTDTKAQKVRGLGEFKFVVHLCLSNGVILPLNKETANKINLAVILGSETRIIFLHHSAY